MKGFLFILLILMHSAEILCAKDTRIHEQKADSAMQSLYSRMENRNFPSGEYLGTLYLKQRTMLDKWNLGLNMIPGMTHFDSDESDYLTELFYDVHLHRNALPTIRRRAHLTTHSRGRGEMERVLDFMTPTIYNSNLFSDGYLSPLHRKYSKFYRFYIDTISPVPSTEKSIRVVFKPKYDNIKLFREGWLILDDSAHIDEFYVQGWDEQCDFSAHYHMSRMSDMRQLVDSVKLEINYHFAGNRLHITANGVYDYKIVEKKKKVQGKGGRYNISGTVDLDTAYTLSKDYVGYAEKHRRLELTTADSVLYARKGVWIDKNTTEEENPDEIEDIGEFLWAIGDGMISSHSLKWEGGGMKISPIINPSYLSYSSNRGLAYRMSVNLSTMIGKTKEVALKPMVGYNFKQNTFYWDIKGSCTFDPMRLGSISLNVGSGNRTFSSIALDKIRDIAADSLDFEELKLDYFRNLYANIAVKREISNGLEVQLGANFYTRKLIGAYNDKLSEEGVNLKERYTQFAPNVRITWHPGMYYYIKGGRKVNVGSRMPRLSLDVEQGINGILGSTGVYTRAEIDAQYRLKINSTDDLFLRAGGGGFFYTKNVYFADYAFFKHNYLPIDRSSELGGVFQLLDSQWYNAANKYFRMHATYESPFLAVQRTFPGISFIKNEHIYMNMLFISHLTPYSEIGYGIETPYIDLGVFVSGKNHQFHNMGCKITVTLFEN